MYACSVHWSNTNGVQYITPHLIMDRSCFLMGLPYTLDCISSKEHVQIAVYHEKTNVFQITWDAGNV